MEGSYADQLTCVYPPLPSIHLHTTPITTHSYYCTHKCSYPPTHPPTPSTTHLTGTRSSVVHFECRVTISSGGIAQEETAPALPSVPCVCVLPLNVQRSVMATYCMHGNLVLCNHIFDYLQLFYVLFHLIHGGNYNELYTNLNPVL